MPLTQELCKLPPSPTSGGEGKFCSAAFQEGNSGDTHAIEVWTDPFDNKVVDEPVTLLT